ncbi:HD domain-containing protein [Soehngenia longivitae]|uniref:HD domain-containing protein n=1 Tax=Soehngenia longivitae TaxID=2562294 RepID=A0A4Z0D8C2_9FIRM|nr:HD domain-containing protein [Soehngenia longivitae]TFZ41159.1 HD domain-containing protein [Soehngenia longivitae]
MDEKLIKDINFIVEIDKMKSIYRRTEVINEKKREDDAQHSWHIAIMAMVLHEYCDEEIDLLKTIKMLLIHDLVEIYAGDTFCYDKIANGDKKDREKIAAEKIFGLLEEDKGEEFKALWEEFEAMETPEARFSASMDRLQPMLNNYNNGGGTWKEYSVPKEDIYKRIEPVKYSSKKLWEFVLYMLEDAQKKGYIIKD